MAETGSPRDDRWGDTTAPQVMEAVFSHLAVGVILTDRSGRITAANPHAGKLLGRTAAAMVGAELHTLLYHGADMAAQPPSALLTAVGHGRPAWGDAESLLHSGGRPVPVSWTSAPFVQDGRTRATVLLFADATESRMVQDRQAAHLDAMENLTERMTLLGEVTTVLIQTLDTEEALSRLGRLVVPRLADWVAVDLRTGDPGGDEVHRVAVAGPAGRTVDQEAWQGPLPPVTGHSRSSLARVLRGGEAVLLEPGEIAAPPDTPLAAVQAGFLQAVGATSAMVVPLGTTRQVTGALTVARTAPGRPFGPAELGLFIDIGRRAGLAIENARLFERQRDITATMQRHLLPQLPETGRLRLAVRYRPAPIGSEVGGDWYDAFRLRDGAIALIIGDVIGHDIQAAAHMAQLRNMLRALAWDRTEPPSAIVHRLNETMPAITDTPMATLILARVEGPEDGPWRLHWTSAGHPPPLLVTGDGHARYLEQKEDLLLSAYLDDDLPRHDTVDPLPFGATVLLYTDGLVETPGSDLDTGLGRLRRNAAALARHPVEDFCDQLLDRMLTGSTDSTGSTDDTAILALRVPGPQEGRTP